MLEQCVYEKTYNDYGKIIITLDSVLEEKKVNLYRLSILTGINWGVLKKYVNGDMYRVDLDLLAKVCYVLNCNLEDILHYEEIKTK